MKDQRLVNIFIEEGCCPGIIEAKSDKRGGYPRPRRRHMMHSETYFDYKLGQAKVVFIISTLFEDERK